MQTQLTIDLNNLDYFNILIIPKKGLLKFVGEDISPFLHIKKHYYNNDKHSYDVIVNEPAVITNFDYRFKFCYSWSDALDEFKNKCKIPNNCEITDGMIKTFIRCTMVSYAKYVDEFELMKEITTVDELLNNYKKNEEKYLTDLRTLLELKSIK